MKLNGQFYVRMSVVMDYIHDVSTSLSGGSYHEISEAISNIKPENAQTVVTLIDDFVDELIYPYSAGSDKNADEYVKLLSVTTAIEASLYDPKYQLVALFKTGAYGIKVDADSDAINKYIYNVCMHMLVVNIKKLGA
jgi:hypothetical protein